MASFKQVVFNSLLLNFPQLKKSLHRDLLFILVKHQRWHNLNIVCRVSSLLKMYIRKPKFSTSVSVTLNRCIRIPNHFPTKYRRFLARNLPNSVGKLRHDSSNVRQISDCKLSRLLRRRDIDFSSAIVFALRTCNLHLHFAPTFRRHYSLLVQGRPETEDFSLTVSIYTVRCLG